MRRKTQCRANKFRFTVLAQDLSCRKAIAEMAEEQKINVKRGGRPKLRLYFACSMEKFHSFYREIEALCTIEPQVVCHCPHWLQRGMAKNLCMAIRNSKLNVARSEMASRILASLAK